MELIRELSVCLEQRRQPHAVGRQSGVSPDRRQSPVESSRQPSYINQPLALNDDPSDDDDDDDYVKPNRGVAANHVDKDDEEDEEEEEEDEEDNDDDDDDNDDDVGDSDCDTLGRRYRRKKCHDYINVMKCHQ